MVNNRRNQRMTIIALVVGIFAISIGFAAFSNTLSISTTADVHPDSSNFRVVFSNIKK